MRQKPLFINSVFSALLLTFASSTAFARSELAAHVYFASKTYKVYAEFFFDKEKKSPDLWVDYEDLVKNSRGERAAFRATSLSDRLTGVEWELKAAPVTHIDGRVLLIYYGFKLATGEYDGNRSMAVLQHYPLAELSDQSRELIAKHFPDSIGRDRSGRPSYVKALLCRMTESQVYPIAAFDTELPL